MATRAQASTLRMTFWQKMALGLALFIAFGFAQFSARGFVDLGHIPAYIHLHALVMLGWLGLTVAQPMLAERRDRALHRKLGWIGAVLAALIVGLGSYVAIKVIAAHHVPPFFTPPYFLALTQIGLIAFGGLVAAGIARRRETQWHRRLIIGSTVMLMEPALGRILPMPLIMPWGEWAVLLVQIGALAIVAGHDRRTLGAVHPATISSMAVVTLTHFVVELLAIASPVVALAGRIGGA
ncbi:MAG: hypothetical protein ABIT04_04670 [Novosphingobium sp.]